MTRRLQRPSRVRRIVRRAWRGLLPQRRTPSVPLFSLKQVAERFRVSKQAVWRWVSMGKLKARKSRRDGVLRVSRSEVARFARRRHRQITTGR
jgi:excisionase family DNA binding protein